ncbi:transmembrane protein 45B-like [Limulus polyphemus]|uniref:Transmembrane protein 45B-like n=1 Tax=Limulus polyphemus TaxID=6850 RepID=A0ABM1B6M1_LIMPO|nr:transmembrane protein 45B-like [Limulus polyphemus]
MRKFADFVFLGGFLILFALYWTLQHVLVLEARGQRAIRVRRWKFGYRAELKRQQTPSSSGKVSIETKNSKICPDHRRWPLEGMLKISFAIIGIAREICAAFPKGTFRHVEDIHHASMYAMFVLSGVVDIFCQSKIIFPKGTSNFVLALAFGVEALILAKVEIKSSMEEEIQYLLVWTVLLCFLFTFAEMRFPTHIPLKFVRSYFTLLQGCWSVQMGFIFNNSTPSTSGLSPWISSINKSDKFRIWVSLIFSWYIGGAFIMMSIFATIIMLIKRKGRCWRSMGTWCNGSSEEAESLPSFLGGWEETEPLYP